MCPQAEPTPSLGGSGGLGDQGCASLYFCSDLGRAGSSYQTGPPLPAEPGEPVRTGKMVIQGLTVSARVQKKGTEEFGMVLSARGEQDPCLITPEGRGHSELRVKSGCHATPRSRCSPGTGPSRRLGGPSTRCSNTAEG